MFAYSQTKLIAHKSHSGSNETFALAVENDLFNDGNLGLGGMEISEYTRLDSVIYIAKDKVILSSSNYTQRRNRRDVCVKDELTKIIRDTLTINPKYTKKGLTIPEVQAKLKTLKTYSNNPEEVVYKDFDEKSKRKKNKKSIFGILPSLPNIPNSFFLAVIVTILSVLVFLIASTFKQEKTVLIAQ
jgi:hypothetical protein